MALGEEDIASEQIIVPRGDFIRTEIYDIRRSPSGVSCAVKKDAGDDPDITNGIFVYARVELNASGMLQIDGGKGVGRVTKPGLSQKIGEAAINIVPRKMIEKEVREVLDRAGRTYGARVIIFIPEGEALAKKTFNPRLGIVGGISVLGTTGIVEPMSEQALLKSIETELSVLRASGAKKLLMMPGNYGEQFLKETLHISTESAVKCSNFIGDTIDLAMEAGFQGILLVGHVGKLVKLAAGIMNTHSHQADGRMEVFTAHAALAGAPVEVLLQVMDCISTDEAIRILKDAGYFQKTMERIVNKIEFHLKQRCLSEVPIGAVVYSMEHGILGMTGQAQELLREIGGLSCLDH